MCSRLIVFWLSWYSLPWRAGAAIAMAAASKPVPRLYSVKPTSSPHLTVPVQTSAHKPTLTLIECDGPSQPPDESRT